MPTPGPSLPTPQRTAPSRRAARNAPALHSFALVAILITHAHAQTLDTSNGTASNPPFGPPTPTPDVIAPSTPSQAQAPASTPSDATDRESLPLGVVPNQDPANPQSPAGALDAAPDLGPTLAALAGVVALILVVMLAVRALRPRQSALATARAPSGILEILGRYPLPAGPTLLVLRADRRILLLSQARASRLGGATLSTLAAFESPDEVASILAQARDARDESISARFHALLAGFSAEHRTDAAHPLPARDAVHVSTIDPPPQDQAHDAPERLACDDLDRLAPAPVEPDPPEITVARRHVGASILRQRLDALRAWEGAPS